MPSKAEIEKRIATMGDPKSNGKWREFVEKNKAAEKAKPRQENVIERIDRTGNLCIDITADHRENGCCNRWSSRLVAEHVSNLQTRHLNPFFLSVALNVVVECRCALWMREVHPR